MPIAPPARGTRCGCALRAPAAAAGIAARAPWETPQARALFGGVAAHAFARSTRPMSSSVGLRPDRRLPRLRLAGREGRIPGDHRRARLGPRGNGGKVETGRRVTSLDELGSADVVVSIWPRARSPRSRGSGSPPRVARAYRRYRHGPGAFKLDLAVEGGVPWTNESCRRAGTVHVAGTFEEIAIAERAINRGSMPERPYMLVGQQYLADPSRSEGGPASGLGLRARPERLRR